MSANAIADASGVTRARGWVAVGQLHSHPGRDVEHSWYDDENAISTRIVSIVVPGYARGPSDPRSWPTPQAFTSSRTAGGHLSSHCAADGSASLTCRSRWWT